jgi:hypothetical protein
MKRDTASPAVPRRTTKTKTSASKPAASNVVAMPTPESRPRALKAAPTRLRAKAMPAADDIAVRAYYLFEARGLQHGHDLDDWLRAESELTAMMMKTPRKRAASA